MLINWLHGSFVDRDMVMRYHFGLGVGHVYSHGSASIHLPTPQIASTSSVNRTSGIADVSSCSPQLSPRSSGPATNLDVTESSGAEFEDSEDNDEDSDFEDSESEILGSVTSNESDALDFDSDVDADLEELAAEEMYYQ